MPRQLWMNMIKVLWRRLKKCFWKFTVFLVEGSSKTGLFRHLSDYVFWVRNFGKTKLWGSSLFLKYSRFNLDFKNATRSWEKVFCFWDNCIWIGIIKLSLLRTKYFSSADIVLTWNPKILYVNKRNFFPTQFSGQWSLNMIKVL